MRTALTLICATLLAASVGARPADAKDKAESSPEVAEAAELTAKVVKLSNEGKYQEALPLAQRALELREKALGREHPLVGDALLNLAVITRNLGKIEESKGFYLRAEAIYEKGGDESAKGLISILDGLSRVEAYLPKAVELQERSLALKVKVYGPESPQITSSLFALGHLNDILGNYEKAEQFFRRFSEIREKAKEGTEDDLAVSYLRLACLSAKAGKQDESKAEESHAREILKSVADKHGPVEGGVINGKALSKPQPPYPDIAKRASAQGTIEVQILISETGNVLAACARGDGNPALKRASELAAYRAKFAPTTIDGKPVKVIGVITYKFVLF